MPSRRSLIAAAALLAGGVALGMLASGGTADLAPERAAPAKPVLVDTRPATHTEVAAARLAVTAKRATGGRLMLKPLISRRPIETDPGTGDFVGLQCPQKFVAVSGGALTGFINLLMSQSAPINPRTGKYTPRVWWVAVTNNEPVQGGEALQWTPLVNCLNKIAVSR